MSIKTLRKRIALVAVSALGVGLLSVAPASADTLAATSITTTANASTGICVDDNAAGLTTVVIAKTGTLALTMTAGDTDADDTVKASGVAYFASVNVAGTDASISADQKKITDLDGTGYTFTVSFTGTGTGSIYSQAGGSGANVQTISVTVVDSCAGTTTASAANSFMQVVTTSGEYQTAANAGTTTQASLASWSSSDRASTTILDGSSDVATTFDNASSAFINVTAKNAYKGLLAGTSYYYQLTCTGDVVVNDSNSNSAFITGVASHYTVQFDVDQATANSPTTAVCTVNVNGVALGSKTIKFLGDLAKIEALTYIRGTSGAGTGDDSTAGRIRYRLFDSAGNRLDYDQSGLGTIALTATNSPIVNAIAVKTNTTQTASGYVRYNCVGATVSGSVTVTLKATNAAGATISANPVTVTCSQDMYTYEASLDKASYQKGEVATLTITAKDITGALTHDWMTLGDADYPLAIVVNGMTAVATPTDVDTFTDGVKKYSFAVGTTAGNYVASVSLPLAGSGQDPVTIKYTIASEAGVSNAEVLAAIVKLIASINKQIRALQKSLKR